MIHGTSIGHRSRRPAVFFDRDGVLNRDTGYVYRIQDFDWKPGAQKAIQYLNELGFLVFVVTNQAGVARGYYEIDDVISLHNWINLSLKKPVLTLITFIFALITRLLVPVTSLVTVVAGSQSLE